MVLYIQAAPIRMHVHRIIRIVPIKCVTLLTLIKNSVLSDDFWT